MLKKKKTTTYRFPFVKDADGYPRLSSGVSKEENQKYQRVVAFLYQNLQTAKCSIASPKESLVLKIDPNRFHPVCITSDKCKALKYPTTRLIDRTVDTSGEVLLITHMVIEYFNKSYSVNLLEDLLNIAIWGGWHRTKGTRLHYIDVVCEAYGIETTRLSTIGHIFWWMKRGGVSVALLENELFPEFSGDCLVFVTEICIAQNYIKYYFLCDEEETTRTMEIEDFILHTKVLWGMEIK